MSSALRVFARHMARELLPLEAENIHGGCDQCLTASGCQEYGAAEGVGNYDDSDMPPEMQCP